MEINTRKIFKDATDYENKRVDLENEYRKIVKSLEDLEATWEGTRANKFFLATKEFLPELKNAIDSLKDYTTYLNGVPSAYNTLDNSYANKKIDV